MRLAAIFALISMMSISSSCMADLIVTVERAETDVIKIGDETVFNVYIRSDEATGTITNFGGIDFFVDADDPFGDTTRVDGGTFVDGFSPLFATPFQLEFPTSFQYFIGSSGGVGLTLDTSNTLLATLTLRTSNAELGNYTLSLSGVIAANTAFDEISISDTSMLSTAYSITAVPEPSSLGLLGMLLMGGVIVRFRNHRQL